MSEWRNFQSAIRGYMDERHPDELETAELCAIVKAHFPCGERGPAFAFVRMEIAARARPLQRRLNLLLLIYVAVVLLAVAISAWS